MKMETTKEAASENQPQTIKAFISWLWEEKQIFPAEISKVCVECGSNEPDDDGDCPCGENDWDDRISPTTSSLESLVTEYLKKGESNADDKG
jgi:hypothetical protein